METSICCLNVVCEHFCVKQDGAHLSSIYWIIVENRFNLMLRVPQGRQDGVNIDPWEDADYNLYKVTDRFGFLQ